MIRKEVMLKNESGLHARPASLFVKEASKYASEIKVIKGGKEYNGKSIIGLLSIAASKNDTIIIESKGIDEEIAINRLVKLIKNLKD